MPECALGAVRTPRTSCRIPTARSTAGATGRCGDSPSPAEFGKSLGRGRRSGWRIALIVRFPDQDIRDAVAEQMTDVLGAAGYILELGERGDGRDDYVLSLNTGPPLSNPTLDQVLAPLSWLVRKVRR